MIIICLSREANFRSCYGRAPHPMWLHIVLSLHQLWLMVLFPTPSNEALIGTHLSRKDRQHIDHAISKVRDRQHQLNDMLPQGWTLNANSISEACLGNPGAFMLNSFSEEGRTISRNDCLKSRPNVSFQARPGKRRCLLAGESDSQIQNI